MHPLVKKATVTVALGLVAGWLSMGYLSKRPPVPDLGGNAARMLVDTGHGGVAQSQADQLTGQHDQTALFETDQPPATGLLQVWTAAVRSQQHRQVDPLSAAHQLASTPAPGQVLMVAVPERPYRPAEKAAVHRWVAAGGGLLLVAGRPGEDHDGDGWDSVRILNDLVTGADGRRVFGFAFSGLAADADTARPTEVGAPEAEAVLAGPFGQVLAVPTRYAAPVQAEADPAAGQENAPHALMTGESGAAYLMVARHGQGRVLAWSPGVESGRSEPLAANAQVLALNATEWLAQG